MRKPRAKTNLSLWVLMPAVCPEMVCRSRFLPGSNGMTLAKAHVAAATSTQGTLRTGLCIQNSSQPKAASSPSSSTFKPPVWVQAWKKKCLGKECRMVRKVLLGRAGYAWVFLPARLKQSSSKPCFSPMWLSLLVPAMPTQTIMLPSGNLLVRKIKKKQSAM